MQLFSIIKDEHFSGMISSFLNGIPNIVLGIIIMIIGLIIAKIITKAIKKLLAKVGVDKIGDQLNEIEFISKSNVEIKISSLFSTIIYYFLVALIAVIAADIVNLPALTNIVSELLILIPKILMALVILMIGVLFAEVIRKIVLTALNSIGIPSANLIASFIFYFLVINFALSALKQAEISTEILSQNISIVIGGIVLAFSIGYGLASKSVVANFLGSYYIKDKFNVGDTVTFEGIKGQIIDISNNAIRIKTEDSTVIFPLSEATKNKITIH